MNVLVTGANGQLGMELRRGAASGPHRFIFTDMSMPSDAMAEPSCTPGAGNVSLRLDITDSEAVRRLVTEYNVGVIVNCAAYTNVDRAEDEPDAAFAVNCTAAGSLARTAAAVGATLIHISTDYVFDGSLRRPYAETDAPAPLNVYGRTKLAGEKTIEDSGCKWLIFRTSGLYSPYGNNFVKTIRRLLMERDSISVVDDQICTPTCAADLVSLIVKIIDEGLYDRTGMYNFSGEGQCSWYEFACAIAELSARQYGSDIVAKEASVNPWSACRVSPCHAADYPSKALRPAYSVLDKTKVMETFGISIPHWRRSLSACLRRKDVI